MVVILKIMITGRPGIGKTTLFTRVVSELRRSYGVAGFMCPEVREAGVRVGFKIIDLASGDEGWLAMSIDRLGGCGGLRVGKYCVLEDDVNRVMARTRASLPMASLIAIDEIGPMELNVRSSREVIELALSMKNPGIFVTHHRLVDEVASRLRSSGALYKIYTLDLSNRDKLHYEILTLIKRILGSNK